MVFFKPVEFQREEDKGSGEICDLTFGIGHKFGAVGIERVLIIPQARVRHHAPASGFDEFVSLHAGQHLIGRQAGKFALIAGRKTRAGCLKPRHITGKFRAVGVGVQIGQVPIGQVGKSACGTGGAGVKDGAKFGEHGDLMMALPLCRGAWAKWKPIRGGKVGWIFGHV